MEPTKTLGKLLNACVSYNENDQSFSETSLLHKVARQEAIEACEDLLSWLKYGGSLPLVFDINSPQPANKAYKLR